ncbi:MAG: hypothetical protein DCC55_16390 [Chloroflexi bacterium]|nr:MAG: hypothetical protein DCC55_16390 [Chloroflexota bacterium]
MPALWLQPPDKEHSWAAGIRTGLAAAGFLVYVLSFDLVTMPSDLATGQAYPSFDLIILHVSTQTPDHVAETVFQMRIGDKTPFLLLTDQEPLPFLLAALPAGADAVLAIYTPVEVIVAHCRALVRRSGSMVGI